MVDEVENEWDDSQKICEELLFVVLGSNFSLIADTDSLVVIAGEVVDDHLETEGAEAENLGENPHLAVVELEIDLAYEFYGEVEGADEDSDAVDDVPEVEEDAFGVDGGDVGPELLVDFLGECFRNHVCLGGVLGEVESSFVSDVLELFFPERFLSVEGSSLLEFFDELDDFEEDAEGEILVEFFEDNFEVCGLGLPEVIHLVDLLELIHFVASF